MIRSIQIQMIEIMLPLMLYRRKLHIIPVHLSQQSIIIRHTQQFTSFECVWAWSTVNLSVNNALDAIVKTKNLLAFIEIIFCQ